MKHSYKAVGYFFSRYKHLYLCILVVSIAVAFFEIFNIASILPFLTIFLGGSQPVQGKGVIIPAINSILNFIPLNDKLASALLLLISITVVKTILRIFNEYLIARASGAVLYDVKNDIMRKYSEASYKYFLDNKQGALMFYLLTASVRLSKLLYVLSQLCMDSFIIAAIVLFLFTINPYVSLFLLILALGFNGLVGFIAKKISYELGKEQLNSSAQQSSLLSEFISGIKNIRVYNAVKRWIGLFESENKRFRDAYIKDMVWIAAPTDIMELTAIVILFASALMIKILHPSNTVLYVPIIGIFGMAVVKLLPLIRNTGKLRMTIGGMLPDTEMIYDLLTSDISFSNNGREKFASFNDSIEFRDVWFAYEGKDVLKGLKAVFLKNRINAIIGSSGSGKTTIINLLLGLFEPQRGSITVDGRNLREYDIETWLGRISVVSQDPFIFHSTVADNISFGQKAFSAEEIERAARIANIDSSIRQLPKGYNTVVGERGMKLSGGQQQRIVIARAVLRKPELLILDEATSALDSISEKEVQDAINEVSKTCTIIVIAHRLSTVKRADSIFVLDGGIIAEEGDHERLMTKHGLYKTLYEHQLTQ